MAIIKPEAFSRRQFLTAAAGSVVVPSILPSHLFGQTSPSSRITLGLIGVGSQGVHGNLKNFLQQEDAQVVAVCDVFEGRCNNARDIVNKHYGTTGCKAVKDFRNIIADPEIDAVVISTPDHWHVPMSLLALKAGKDVFCEKPTLTIAEGRTLVDAVSRHKAVFQIGLEDRSKVHFHKMVELIRNGAIGSLKRIKVMLPLGTDFPKEQPVPVPQGLDWNLWLGPAPLRPYTPNRTEMWHWREISDYSGGQITDWGSHLVDTAQLAAGADDVCPIRVEGTGLIPKDSMSNVPVRFDLKYEYSNGIEMHVVSSESAGRKKASIVFEGTDGTISKDGWDGRLQASSEDILRTRYQPEKSKHWQLPPMEQRNFLDCVKSRKATTYTAETMRYLSNTLHMGVIAVQTGHKLRWNPKTDMFIDDDTANRLCFREPRDYESAMK